MTNAHSLATNAMGFVAVRKRAGSAPSRAFADFEIYADPEAASAAWTEIYGDGLATPYQSRDFISVWLETIGHAEAAEALIVVVRDDRGATSAILPLAARRRPGLRIAEFIGGKHANFHMGVFRAGLAVGRDDVVDLLRRVAEAVRLDAFFFVNQPTAWRGSPNPFTAFKGQTSPSCGHSTLLKGDYDQWRDAHYSKAAQKKLRKKARRLEERGPVASFIARDPPTIAETLAAFFALKEERTKTVGLANDFDDPAAMRFLREAAAKNVIELHALRCGERIVAVFAGAAHAGRFCGMVTSYDQDIEIARSSPGELLIHDVIQDLIGRGFTAFDLGVGEARYKDTCCETTEVLCDSALGFTVKGRAASFWFLSRQRLKRWIKQRPWAWSLATRMMRRPR